MPSVLDATVVIQVVHFLCAYWILSKFFLKPAYALVMKIDSERTALKNAAIAQQEELTGQRQEKIAELTEFQHELLRSAPVGPHSSTTLTTSGQPAHPEPVEGLAADKRDQVKQDLIKQLAQQLKKRVIHD